jgi:hypothetical protein
LRIVKWIVGGYDMQSGVQRELADGLADGKTLRQVHDEMNAPHRVAERVKALRAERNRKLDEFYKGQVNQESGTDDETVNRILGALVRDRRLTFDVRTREDVEGWIGRIAQERNVSHDFAASIFELEVLPLLDSLVEEMIAPAVASIAHGGPNGRQVAFTGSMFAYDPTDENIIAFELMKPIVEQLDKSRGSSTAPLSEHEREQIATLRRICFGTAHERRIERFAGAWESGDFSARLRFGLTGPHTIFERSCAAPQNANIQIVATPAEMVVKTAQPPAADVTSADIARAATDPAAARRVNEELTRRRESNPGFTLQHLEAEVSGR